MEFLLESLVSYVQVQDGQPHNSQGWNASHLISQILHFQNPPLPPAPPPCSDFYLFLSSLSKIVLGKG